MIFGNFFKNKKQPAIPATQWNAVLPEVDRMALMSLFSSVAPDVASVEFLQPYESNYQEYSQISSAEPGLAARRLIYQGIEKVVILADDSFFSLKSTAFLQKAGWSEKNIAQIGFLHELAHAAAWLSPKKLMENSRNPVVSAWIGSFSAWPLALAREIPSLQIHQSCKILSDCSPFGIFQANVRGLELFEHVTWASNLSELRADAVAISFCFAAQSQVLAEHLLRKNFTQGLADFSLSRAQPGVPSHYRWGNLSNALSSLSIFAAHAQPQITQLVAFSECAAYACATGNMPALLQTTPDNPLLTSLYPAFNGQPLAMAAQQAQNSFVLLADCAQQQEKATRPQSGINDTAASAPSPIKGK